MSRRRDDLVSTRRSGNVYLDIDGYSGARDRYARVARAAGGMTEMFVDDVRNGVLPWPRHSLFRARLEGPGADRVERLIAAGTRGDDLTETVHELIRKIVATQLRSRDTRFELDLLHASASSTDVVAIRLHPLLPGSLELRGGELVQYLPTQWAATGEVTLDPSRIVAFALPEPLERRVDYVLSSLARIGFGNSMAFLQVQQRMAGRYDVPFEAFAVAERRVVAVVTADVGWSARGMLSEDELDPAMIWRRLRFLDFCIPLRDAAVTEINRHLVVFSGELGGEASLVLENVPAAADIERARAALEAGTVPLTTLLDLALQHQVPTWPT